MAENRHGGKFFLYSAEFSQYTFHLIREANSLRQRNDKDDALEPKVGKISEKIWEKFREKISGKISVKNFVKNFRKNSGKIFEKNLGVFCRNFSSNSEFLKLILKIKIEVLWRSKNGVAEICPGDLKMLWRKSAMAV